MPYKLIALDLDDTLLGRDGQIGPEHLEGLAYARSRGCEVTFVTARSWRATRAHAATASITLPVVCLGGAAVYATDGALLKMTTLEPTECRPLCDRADGELWTIRLYFPDGRILTSRESEDFEQKLGASYPADLFVGDVTPFIEGGGEAPLQIVLLGHRSVEGGLAQLGRLPHMAPTVYDRATAHSRCHIMHRSVSKGAALAELCRERGIEREAVIAMGDGWPDRSMIEWAGTGVAMGWAPPDVRSAAQLVTAADDPHPVATAIRQLLD